MSAPEPGPATAADLVATADRVHASVRRGASAPYVGWLAGMAAAGLMYLTTLGLATNAGAILVVSGAFVVCVVGLSAGLLPGARVSKAGFPARFGTAVGIWGLAFGLTLGLGLGLFPGQPAFWLPAAVLTSLPLALGARAEARA